MSLNNSSVVVIGLGYVGLPLSVEFQKKYQTTGFDINFERITELKNNVDRTREIDTNVLANLKNLHFTTDPTEIKNKKYYIVTVPTPVDSSNNPDLTALKSASVLVGKSLQKGSIVIYESTVYPGATEEICVPILEKESGLKFNQDFFAGYSPERVNPGDKERTIPKIIKITSGSTPEAANVVNELYASIIDVGTYKVSSIKIAEAAKVIENTQRDINIAFINELAILFNKLNIDTNEVLEAASTKWNFLSFKPGLVGGHCIGVDPYYLTHRAQRAGYHPEIILAGRRLNDSMSSYVASRFIKCLISSGHKISGSKILVLGLTFKENCPDTRNSKVVNLINELQEYECLVDVHDPHALSSEVMHEYKIVLKEKITDKYDGIILAVAHKEFLDFDFEKYSHKNTRIYDLKSILPRKLNAIRL